MTPTKALEGFCRKNGVEAGAVFKEADPKGVEYVWAVVKDAGRPAVEVRRRREIYSKLEKEAGSRTRHVWREGGRSRSRFVRGTGRRGKERGGWE